MNFTLAKSQTPKRSKKNVQALELLKGSSARGTIRQFRVSVALSLEKKASMEARCAASNTPIGAELVLHCLTLLNTSQRLSSASKHAALICTHPGAEVLSKMSSTEERLPKRWYLLSFLLTRRRALYLRASAYPCPRLHQRTLQLSTSSHAWKQSKSAKSKPLKAISTKF